MKANLSYLNQYREENPFLSAKRYKFVLKNESYQKAKNNNYHGVIKSVDDDLILKISNQNHGEKTTLTLSKEAKESDSEKIEEEQKSLEDLIYSEKGDKKKGEYEEEKIENRN